jgi:acyl-CoA thioester hydrolase
MTLDAPYTRHRERVQADWIDYNGHMNVAYYVLAFDHATDAFLEEFGIDEAYRRREGGSVFAVDSRVSYLREVAERDPLSFETQLLGFDAKRLHIFHRMFHAEEGFLVATSEWLLLHIDLVGTRRVAPMPDSVMSRVETAWRSHAALPRPEEVDHPMRVPKTPAPEGSAPEAGR